MSLSRVPSELRQGSLAFVFLLSTFFLLGNSPQTVFGQAVDDIKSQISTTNDKIKDLEKEIAGYQKELNALGNQRQTLQSAIKGLDVSRSKITAQIKLTQSKISAANLRIEELGSMIGSKEEAIALDRQAIAASIRSLDSADDTTLVEHLFSSRSLTEAWTAADDMAQLSDALRERTIDLASAKIVLVDQQAEVAKSRKELISLNNDLSSQEAELVANKRAKEQLLAQTKSQEGSYQTLIAQKRAQQKAFESELQALENSLKVDIDSTRIPSVGSGVLIWPYSASVAESCRGKASALGNPYCITQYFGNTPFATANSQVYNGNGHNAIDIGLPVGTPLLAALSGTVSGTGNTDAIPGCYSYGKWVLIKHANGLSTLYAHLSTIDVIAGQTVTTGQTIGYSGMTGYATGPHLHFSVYASQAVQIMTLAQYRGATSPCANARMPVAPKDGYLNPMSFL